MAVELSIFKNMHDYQFAAFNYSKKVKSDGQQYNKTDSGLEFNVIRFEEYLYSVKLQYISQEDLKLLIKEIDMSKRDNKLITIKSSIIEPKGFLNFSDSTSPEFTVNPETLKPARHTGTKLFSVSFELVERVWP